MVKVVDVIGIRDLGMVWKDGWEDGRMRTDNSKYSTSTP